MKAGCTPRYRNVFHAGQVIFREFGIRGLFQGVGATCLRNTPACSIYFGMMIFSVLWWLRNQQQRAVTVCPARPTASRYERRRPADCLQSCSGDEADVRLACVERLRYGDGPQMSRRVPATL